MLSLIFLSTKLVEKSGRFISSARLVSLQEPDKIYILENSHKQLQVLAKSKTQLQHWKCQQYVVPRSNSRCLSRLIAVKTSFFVQCLRLTKLILDQSVAVTFLSEK